jgi:photosystem II stability/assembly factor-like uncharacterized protein
MKQKCIFLLAFFFLIISNASTQTIEALSSGTKGSFRGLSVVDNNTVWVSGSGGQIGRTTDAGKTWKFHIIKGQEKTEFRDIEAFDAMQAIAMGIGSPANIYRTIDGGETWDLVFSDSGKNMFLDAMEFWNEQSGVVIGDPIDGRFYMARTFNGGRTWEPLPMAYRPIADSGEACFASSGTNIRKRKKDEAIFISGGLKSRIFIRDSSYLLPLLQGTESTGANSIAVKNENSFMVVGGDFNHKDDTNNIVAYTKDGGKTWEKGLGTPSGYRSCVEFIRKKTWITCGLNGVDITKDDGQHFTTISKTGYHVCRKAKKGKAVYFAGGQGRIGKLID